MNRQASIFSKRGGKGLVLLGAFFALIGTVAFFFLFVRPAMHMIESRTWVAAPAVVERSGVDTHSDDGGATYSIRVRYRYSYDGQSYSGENYDFVNASTAGYDSKQRIVDGLRPGTRVTVYVDPTDPHRSVLNRFSHGLWFGLLPLLFVGAGLVFVRMGRRLKAMSVPAAAKGARPEWLPVPKHQAQGGRVVLAPAMTPLGSLALMVLFALFWNGITSVFVFQAVRSHLNRRPEWFLTLFMIPFVLAGLLLIGLAIRQFLALFNPKIELTLDRAEAKPGDVLNLSWNISGATGRLRKLKITLVGEESATYKRGTDTRTDRHEFRTVVVHESERINARGMARIEIPSDAMHAFKASNNSIGWKLKVQGDVPRWPDIAAEYELIVLPKGMVRA